jgi:hypothetical protein
MIFANLFDEPVAFSVFITQSLDVAFLISNHFKNQRSRSRQKGTTDVLYSELGGSRVDA